YGASWTIGWMKFGWSGFRSLLAFAIMAVTSADAAKSLAAAGAAPGAGGCCAKAADESIVRTVKNTCARMTASCGRRLYCSLQFSESTSSLRRQERWITHRRRHYDI